MEVVHVVIASENERDVIGALMKPYLQGLGQSADYPYLPYYWLEPACRFPYLLKVADSVAGFALVRKTITFEMAEFYVRPEFRRQRVGQSALMQLLMMHAGDWTLSIAEDNLPGKAFWKHALRGHVQSLSVDSRDGETVLLRFST